MTQSPLELSSERTGTPAAPVPPGEWSHRCMGLRNVCGFKGCLWRYRCVCKHRCLCVQVCLWAQVCLWVLCICGHRYVHVYRCVCVQGCPCVQVCLWVLLCLLPRLLPLEKLPDLVNRLILENVSPPGPFALQVFLPLGQATVRSLPRGPIPGIPSRLRAHLMQGELGLKDPVLHHIIKGVWDQRWQGSGDRTTCITHTHLETHYNSRDTTNHTPQRPYPSHTQEPLHYTIQEPCPSHSPGTLHYTAQGPAHHKHPGTPPSQTPQDPCPSHSPVIRTSPTSHSSPPVSVFLFRMKLMIRILKPTCRVTSPWPCRD